MTRKTPVRGDIVIDYEVLEEPLPRYSGDAHVVVDGDTLDLHDVANPFAAAREARENFRFGVNRALAGITDHIEQTTEVLRASVRDQVSTPEVKSAIRQILAFQEKLNDQIQEMLEAVTPEPEPQPFVISGTAKRSRTRKRRSSTRRSATKRTAAKRRPAARKRTAASGRATAKKRTAAKKRRPAAKKRTAAKKRRPAAKKRTAAKKRRPAAKKRRR